MCTYNPSVEKKHRQKLRLAGQLIKSNQLVPSSVKLCLKNNTEDSWRRSPSTNLWPRHAHAHTMHMYPYIQKVSIKNNNQNQEKGEIKVYSYDG